MKIFTNSQLKGLLEATVRAGTPLSQIVDNVAAQVAEAVVSRKVPEGSRVFVFAGPGTNGAYALGTARLLLEKGVRPEVYLLNVRGNMLVPETALQRQLLLDADEKLAFNEIIKTFKSPAMDEGDTVVDGIAGPELEKPFSGQGYATLVDIINESGAYIISIDQPSGMCGDWNTQAVNRFIVHADRTLAVGLPRVSFMLADTAPLAGRWQLVDPGLSREYMRKQPAQFYLCTKEMAARHLKERDPFVDKSQLGHLVIYAGSYGMAGAAVMAARGALRSGAGRVTVHAPRCANLVLQSAVPEAMFEADADNAAISDFSLQRPYDAVAAGPGIGTSEATLEALDRFLNVSAANQRPLVLDADALNCIARRPSMLDRLPARSVLTPHAGEFDRIFGRCDSSQERLRRCIEMARHYNVVIVLKGRNTAVCRPDGCVTFCGSGTPAMATAGSGDVLTGVIGSLMAQGYHGDTAATLGCFIHGLAGEIAEQTHGPYGVTSADIAYNIGKAVKTIFEHNS